MESSSRVVCREPCPKCGSRDNVAVYEDGHKHCFGMGCTYHTKPDGEVATQQRREPVPGGVEFLHGEYGALKARGITEETCSKWGYQLGKHNGKPVQIANYYRDGRVVGQKLRYADKTFSVRGSIGDCLYGQHLWGEGGKMVVVTEGEIDALSVSQAQGNKWPVVSIPNGAQGAKRAIAANIEWLQKYETVVLMFDNDDAGRAAVDAVAPLFEPGKLKIASLPLKDANDMVKAGRERELIDAIWRARLYRPDGIVTVDDIIERALQPMERGLPWWSDTLTEWTYGRRLGEVYAIGAGTGVGKTDWITQQIAHDITLGEVPAAFFLEQAPEETLARVAGKLAGKAFHVPDGSWTDEERRSAFEALRGKLFMYDSFGATEWDVVKAKFRYLAVTEGVRIFYLDHLTALADTANERESLEQLMKELAGLANELKIIVVFVSHLATPEGKPHEEGGRVMIRHFKGSRAIGFWSHFMFGIERDQQSEDPEVRNRTIFRVLKDRKTGRSTGKTLLLRYDFDRALLVESKDEDPFEDETQPATKGEF